MATLDDDYGIIDPDTVSPRPIALRYGSIASVILIVLGLVMYLGGMVDYEAAASGESSSSDWMANILNLVVWIGAIVMAIKHHKNNELGGYISFGRGFYTGFLTSLFMGLIGAIWTYIFFSFVAPDAMDIMREAALNQMPEDQAEAAEGMMTMIMSPAIMAMSMFMVTLAVGSIISLIASAIMKNPSPASS